MKYRLIMPIALFIWLVGCMNAEDQGSGNSAAGDSSSIGEPGAQLVGSVPEARIAFDTVVRDIGTVIQGERIVTYFDFTNKGDAPLVINNIEAGCGCTVPEWDRDPFQSGKSGSIKIVFNSSGKKGIQNIPVTVLSNAGNARVSLRLKAIVESN